jgi:hypothetical protein
MKTSELCAGVHKTEGVGFASVGIVECLGEFNVELLVTNAVDVAFVCGWK